MEIIPNITKSVNERLKQLELKTDKSIEECVKNKDRYFFTTRAVKTDKSEYIFRARVANDPFIEKAFENEIIASRFFQKQPGLNNHLRLRELYDWGLSARVDWAVYEYAVGDLINEDFIDDGIIKMILQAQDLLQSVDVSILPPEIYYSDGVFGQMQFKNIKWWDNRFARYLKIIKQTTEELRYPNRAKVINFFEQNYELLRHSPESLAHGDFDLNNLLLYNGRIQLIDWERVTVSNRAYDFANLFTRTIKPWRNKLIKGYLEQSEDPENFKLLFRLMVILQCFYKIYPASLEEDHHEEKESKIWYETVDKALASFEDLTS